MKITDLRGQAPELVRVRDLPPGAVFYRKGDLIYKTFAGYVSLQDPRRTWTVLFSGAPSFADELAVPLDVEVIVRSMREVKG